ncbi:MULTISPECIES: MFS transporter [Gammaproteobacteria]|uniref:MFS transporter n=1 Tax=Gammaproteobacteria TaxID=1236 RepID=UPI0011298F51|nr:MFS transporter [Pseudomonas sp. Hp2]
MPGVVTPLPGEAASPVSRARHAAIIFALAFGGFAIGVSEFSIMGLMPNVASDFGITEQAVGRLISVYALGVVVGAPTMALLGGRVKRKTMLMALMLLYAIANLASALAPDYRWMLIARFVSGLPHGAFFGLAALVAASVSTPGQRGAAVAKVMFGITLALLIGNPLAVGIGQSLSWRYAFYAVSAGALITAVLIAISLPPRQEGQAPSMRQELRDFHRAEVWLALLVGSVGFSGLFCVFSYMAPTMTNVTGVSEHWIPFGVATFGVGSLLGAQVGGWMFDRFGSRAVSLSLIGAVVVLLLYFFAVRSPLSVIPGIVLVGTMGTLVPIMQIHLLDVARDAQGLASASNQAALNVANALGPWFGGLAITAGLGWASTGLVGATLSLAALLIWSLAPARLKRAEVL